MNTIVKPERRTKKTGKKLSTRKNFCVLPAAVVPFVVSGSSQDDAELLKLDIAVTLLCFFML